MKTIEINKLAPDFKISDYKGDEFQLSSFKGNKNVFLVLNRGFS